MASKFWNYGYMRTTKIIFAVLFLMVLFGSSVSHTFAQNSSSTKKEGTFGKFEVGLPGIPKDQTIDDFVKDPDPILRFINLAVNAVIAVIVIIGLIYIVIGGYSYMTAAGDASQVKTAKEIIIAALAGIFLSLISVIILNTINRYVGSSAEEPTLGEPPKNSPGDFIL